MHNCSDDVATTAFINGLRVNHDFYASQVKHNVTKMKEILHRAPGYIQLEEAHRSTDSTKTTDKPKSNASKTQNNKGNGGGNDKRGGKKPSYFNSQRNFQQNVRESVMQIQSSIIFNTPIKEILKVIKDQPWVRCPPRPSTPRNTNSEHYCSYHQGTGHKTVNYRALLTFLQELLKQGYLKEYALTPEITQAANDKKNVA